MSQRSLEAFITKLVDAFRFQSQSLLKKYETLFSNERHVFWEGNVPRLPCNTGGTDVRANIYEEKVPLVLSCSVLVFASFPRLETLCHHFCSFQSGGIIVLLVPKKRQHF